LHEDDNINTFTVEELAEDLNNMLSMYETSKKLTNDMFEVLANFSPEPDF